MTNLIKRERHFQIIARILFTSVKYTLIVISFIPGSKVNFINEKSKGKKFMYIAIDYVSSSGAKTKN